MAGTSYTRQSTLTDGDTITSALFNAEYNQLVTAFSYAATGTTGHQHDGGAGEGGNIEIIGDQDFLNKIVVDSTNNRWSVFVQVGGSAVEQVRIEDGVVYPVTDSDVDLGTNALRFKNAYIDSLTATGNLTVGGNITVTGNVDVDGIVEFDGLSGTGAVTVTNILDEDNLASDSATALATQQSIKAYVDAQQDTVDTFGEVLALSNTTAGTDISVSTDDKVQFRDSAIYINSSADGQLDIVADTEIQIAATTIDINGAINASGEIIAASLDISGNIDVDGTTNLDVVDIDGAVDMATTLAVAGNVDFNGDLDVDGTIEFDAISGTGSVTVTDILDQDDMSGNSATALATQQSIKAYVDAQQDTVDTLAEILALSNTSSGTDVELTTTDKVQFRDSAIYINSSTDGQLDIVADTEIQIAATTIDINGAINASGEIIAASLDISGNIDVDGVTNLDVVDIDGAVDMASTLAVADTTTIVKTASGVTKALKLYNNTAGANNRVAIDFHTASTLYGTIEGGYGATSPEMNFIVSSIDNLKLSTSGAVFNEGSADIDFRVESNGNANMLFVDGGNDSVGIGTSAIGTINSVAFSGVALHVKKDTLGRVVFEGSSRAELILNDSGGSANQRARYVNSDGGVLSFGAYDDNGTARSHLSIANAGPITIPSTVTVGVGITSDYFRNASDSTEFNLITRNNAGSALYVQKPVAGTILDVRTGNSGAGQGDAVFTVSDTLIVANDSSGDRDFRVESNGNANMLFVDGGNDQVIIGTSSGLNPSDAGLYARNGLIVGNFSGSGNGFTVYRGSNLNTNISHDSTKAFLTTSGIPLHFRTTEDANYKISMLTGGVVINEGGADLDFRVESDGNANAFHVDGATSIVGINTNDISSYTSSNALVSKGRDFALVGAAGSGATSNHIRFWQDSGTAYEIARININVGAGQINRGEMEFEVNNGAALRPWLNVNYQGNVVFNEDGNDSDFRVESDNNPNAFRVDGGDDQVRTDAVFVHDADGANQPFYITRSGGLDQGLKVTMDDSNVMLTSVQDETSGANFIFYSTNATTSNLPLLQLDYSAGAVFNESGVNYQHVRMESDTDTHAFYLNAVNGFIGMGAGASPPLPLSVGSKTGASLNYINGTANSISTDSGIFVSKTTTNEATVGFGLQLANNSNVADTRSPLIGFSALSASTSYNHTYAAIWGLKSGSGADSNWNTGQLHFGTSDGTGVDTRMKLSQVGGLITLPAVNGHAVFNEEGVDADFRVESDGYNNIINVIASDDAVNFHKSVTSVSTSGFTIGIPTAGVTSSMPSGNTYHVYRSDGTDNGYKFYVNFGGQINSTSTSISSLSDERLKENIVDLETGLTEVIALKPRRFDWKGNGNKNVAGFIAQEVETVLPELIGDFLHDDLADAKSVKIGDMVPTLVKAIQEHYKRLV